MISVYRGADIHTMDGKNTVLQGADLWIADGKIIKVGVNTDIPADVQVTSVDGCLITPGLIDIHTHVGIWGEINERINDACEY